MGGWVLDFTRLMLISTQVEVGVELGNNNYFNNNHYYNTTTLKSLGFDLPSLVSEAQIKEIFSNTFIYIIVKYTHFI